MKKNQKADTKEMLANSLKALMLEHVSFDKITIKDITNRAGLIRPTFYNHFQDKYELLEWIFFQDIIVPSYVLIETGMVEEAVRLVLVKIRSEKDVLSYAYKVGGQNSFEKMVFNSFYQWSLHLHESCGKTMEEDFPIWAHPENVSYFYANNMALLIKMWNEDAYKKTVDEMIEAIEYLSNHTFAGYVFGENQ